MTTHDGKPRWEVLEDWLFDSEVERFAARELAASLGVPRWEASLLINSHLAAQRSPRSRTLFVLKRTGRTSQAVWSVGVRTADLEILNDTLYGDISVKIRKAWQPDLDRLRALNPRAARRVQLTLEGVLDGALAVMAAALGASDTDDE